MAAPSFGFSVAKDGAILDLIIRDREAAAPSSQLMRQKRRRRLAHVVAEVSAIRKGVYATEIREPIGRKMCN
jgi:hypothetical protein